MDLAPGLLGKLSTLVQEHLSLGRGFVGGEGLIWESKIQFLNYYPERKMSYLAGVKMFTQRGVKPLEVFWGLMLLEVSRERRYTSTYRCSWVRRCLKCVYCGLHHGNLEISFPQRGEAKVLWVEEWAGRATACSGRDVTSDKPRDAPIVCGRGEGRTMPVAARVSMQEPSDTCGAFQVSSCFSWLTSHVWPVWFDLQLWRKKWEISLTWVESPSVFLLGLCPSMICLYQ